MDQFIPEFLAPNMPLTPELNKSIAEEHGELRSKKSRWWHTNAKQIYRARCAQVLWNAFGIAIPRIHIQRSGDCTIDYCGHKWNRI
jgi:hypothetical protein